jgi:hypothetical protein
MGAIVSLAPGRSAFKKLLGVDKSAVINLLAGWGWIFCPCGLDALQNREAQENNCTHCDPMRSDMQNHGPIDQPGNYYQEADNVDRE